MKLILLGGISLKNRDWIEQVRDELKEDFEKERLDLKKLFWWVRPGIGQKIMDLPQWNWPGK